MFFNKNKDIDGIFIDNVTKYYTTKAGRKYVLKNETFLIPPGRNVGLLGKNGAGKSTLLRMLGGLDYPNSGKIISNKTFSWPMALSGGFQGSLSGKDNCRFVAMVYGKTDIEIKEILLNVKEFSELNEYFTMPVNTYSSGMKSKLAFGLSIAFDFNYYLIDETLSVGDPKFKNKCETEISRIKDTRNIILVSHDTKTIKKMSDIVIVLDKGKMKLFEDVDEGIQVYENQN
jgi:capsular polysaccharide transport system ATP-binding protein